MVYTVEVTATDNRDGALPITPTYKIGKNVVLGIRPDNLLDLFAFL